ncbi:MAG: EamA family transporter [Methylotenera sp.]|nr:EamA family transporter [Oligoflexia bacterium]
MSGKDSTAGFSSSSSARPLSALLISIVSIQLGASFAKRLFPLVGAAGATGLRTTVATLLLFVIWRPWRQKISRVSLLAILPYGASLGLMNLLFYWSIARIPLGVAVALEFTGPLGVAILSSKRPKDFIWAILAAAGVALILPLSPASVAIDPLGAGLALAAGGFWALYIIFGQKASHSMHEGRAAALGMAVAALVTLPVAVVQSGAQLLHWNRVPLALTVGVFSSALPYSLEMYALKKIPAKTFGILMSLEPAVAAFFGLLLLHESLAWIQWTAIACIMVASAGSSLSIDRAVQVGVIDPV